MIVCVRDEDGVERFVETIPTKITVPIYYPERDLYINAEWYKFKPFRAIDKIDRVKPFFYFLGDSFAVFGNNINDIKFEKMGRYSQNLFGGYLVSLLSMKYRGDFDQFILNNTTDENDEDITFIHWKLGKNTPPKWEDGGKHLTFTIDGTESRSRVFLKWFRKVMEVRLRSWVNMAARKMKLLDKIMWVKFEDPTSLKRYSETSTNYFEHVKVGVDGTNYHQDVISDYETTIYEDDKKSTIKYTPFVFFMDPKTQKILLIHELVHTKIGFAHKHDKYFWYLLQYYSGYKKEEDNSWTQQIEDKDTKEYNSKTTAYTCDELIEQHKRWVANGSKGRW